MNRRKLGIIVACWWLGWIVAVDHGMAIRGMVERHHAHPWDVWLSWASVVLGLVLSMALTRLWWQMPKAAATEANGKG